MRWTTLSIAVAAILTLSPQATEASIRVTSPHHVGTPTAQIQNDVYWFMFNRFIGQSVPPPLADIMAQQVVSQMIVIDRLGSDKLTTRITESDQPGELLPCIIIVYPDNTVQTTEMETVRGDGDFTGPPILLDHTPVWGAFALYEGQSSQQVPMKLLLRTTWF